MGWRANQPPLTETEQPFDRIKLLLYDTSTGRSDGDVSNMDGVKLVYESTPPGQPCPIAHPGDGQLSVESDRPPLVVISRLVGYTEGRAPGSRVEITPAGRLTTVRRRSLAELAAGSIAGGAEDMDSAPSFISHKHRPSVFELTREVIQNSY